MVRRLSLSLGALGLSAASIIACSGGTQPSSSDPATQSQALGADSGARGGRPHGPHGPPPAAFDACTTKATGDACNVKFGDKDIAGTCTAPPAGAPDARIFCLPKDMPPPGEGRPHHPPPPEAFTACDGKASDATCSVKLTDRTIDGVCRTPPPNSGETRLVCVPPHGPHGPGGPGGPGGPPR